MSARQLAIGANFVLAPGALALAFGLEGYWFLAVIVLSLGIGGWHSWREGLEIWRTDYYFGGLLLIAALGVFFELAPALLLVAVLGALAGWDLLRFLERFEQSFSPEAIVGLEEAHIARLGLALLGGGVLAAAALVAQIQVGFGLALLLAGVLVVSLGRLVRLLRN